MKKQTMEELDRLNLLWVLEKISVGNLVRGIAYLVRLATPVKKCVVSTADKVKTVIKDEIESEQKPKEPVTDTSTSETKK